MHITECAFYLVCLGRVRFKRSQTLLLLGGKNDVIFEVVCASVRERGAISFAPSPWIRLPPAISDRT